MDSGVDEDKHPNGRRHVAHTGPHAHHGTGVVVGLESGAQLALGQDDESVENLVELAEVEDPSVESQALVPDAAHVGTAGSSITCQGDVARVGSPASFFRAVEDGIAEACGAMETGHAVDETIDALGRSRIDHTTVHDADHTVKRPCRVYSQEDIMCHDEGVEETGFADGPWLLAIGGVVDIQELSSDGIDGSNCQWDFGVESGSVEVVWDQYWRS